MNKNNSAYNSAINFAKRHYENFPVISFLIPKELRKDVAIVYWFARTADDFADEGIVPLEIRLKNLDNFENSLAELLNGNYKNNFEEALSLTIKNRKLNTEYFFNLLKAFKQDVTKNTYNNFDEILSYCKNSANPVGRLILELFNIRDQKAFLLSDNICTALQLTNFYQDLNIDLNKGRIYLPLDELKKYKLETGDLYSNIEDENIRNLIKFNVERAMEMFNQGKGLLNYLSGRLKYEINWTIMGGELILRKIEKMNYEVLSKRPSLSKKDYFGLLLKSIIMR
jgi:squalene synthase HpnC